MSENRTRNLVFHQVYIDESGDVTPYSGSCYLILAAMITKNSRHIELQVKRVRQRLGWKGRPDELKASDLESHVTEQLLAVIAQETEIVLVIVDKRAILRPPFDPEDIYRIAASRLIRQCVTLYPHVEIWLDKRYTNRALRDRLERSIRTSITDIPQQIVLLYQEDSRKYKGLQAVDHVAWAFFQKYERHDDRFAKMVQHRVVKEEILEQRLW